MDKHSEMIWQRGSARRIMRQARKSFHQTLRKDAVSARVAMASVHYSLVKRYMTWWQRPLAFWHLFHALRHVHGIFPLVGGRLGSLGFDQIDVISRILARAPVWLGGDPVCASSLLHSVLYLDPPFNMKPHTRALMFITLGEIQCQLGKIEQAADCYGRAHGCLPLILDENSDDREQQAVRVRSAVGFFYHRYGQTTDMRDEGIEMVLISLRQAYEVSRDQWFKIRAECDRRGIVYK